MSENDLTGRVIVVTGASRGLGAGMAAWFAARGAGLGLCARREPARPSGVACLAGAVDMTDEAAVADFAANVTAAVGPIDLWINNAGVLEPIVAQRDLTSAALMEHLHVNVGGVLNGTRAYLQQLPAGRQGALVNISSGAAGAGRAGWSAYCAGKAAVDRLTEAVASEEKDRLRLALSVYPGLIDTDMQAFIRTQTADVQPDVNWFKKRHDDGAMNNPAWVAETIAGWVFGDVPNEGVIARVPDGF